MSHLSIMLSRAKHLAISTVFNLDRLHNLGYSFSGVGIYPMMASVNCLLLSVFLSLLFSSSVFGQNLFDSPLKPCPESPNCSHQVRTYPIFASELSYKMVAALESLGPESLEIGTIDTHSIQAVFKIWGYLDDVEIAILPEKNGSSTLYIRSASREGFSDLGVNRRRVKKILRRLDKLIDARE